MRRNDEDRPRILMVDDEADFLTAVRRWVSLEYEMRGVTDGGGILEQLREYDPSVLVLDVRMPGEDGFAVCRRVRAEPRWAELPVLFLTGSREDEDFLRNLKAGGTAWLAKPVGRIQLLNALRELVPEPTAQEMTGTVD